MEKHDADVRFSDLEEFLLDRGYIEFLKVEGCENTTASQEAVATLKEQYSKLSNVVHPKPYNFETELTHRFEFSKSDLVTSLDAIEKVQISFIRILLCRFNILASELKSPFPQLDELI